MLVKAEGSVQGYVERRSKEGKVFRSVDLYVKGRDPGNLRLNIPEEHGGLVELCKQSEGKRATASIELRKFEQTGRIFFDLTALDILK
jgi:hypothetical protein